ncbi:MAG: Gfo/Idh/MocA family oxidoreductase [Planctomycetes bacterium]|nr:Gfo/Idh/MocA family oxidoreductase [Planctomycetota bacterium]
MAKAAKPLKLALIGCGRRGLGVYGPALAHCAAEQPGRIGLAVAVDTDAGRAREACGQFGFAAAAEDIAAALRDHKPDLCLLALPADQTMMQGAQLLAQSMPCTLELPLGDSLEAMMELSEAAAEGKTPHAVVLNRRFHPCLTRAGRWARQIGPVRSIDCTLATGGPLDAACAAAVTHAVDVLAHLAGRAGGYTLAAGPVVTVPLGEAVVGTLRLQGEAPAPLERYTIAGSGFRAVATVQAPEGPSLRCFRGDRMEVDIAVPDAPDGTGDALAAVLGALAAGKRPAPAIDDAMPAADLAWRIAAELARAAVA